MVDVLVSFLMSERKLSIFTIKHVVSCLLHVQVLKFQPGIDNIMRLLQRFKEGNHTKCSVYKNEHR